MSVQATSWVWEHSESGGNARLVLLAIADAADADGDNAWPTQARMAAMVRVSVRTVRRLVSELIMLGELEMEEHAGGTARTRDDRRPHLYRLPKMSTGGHDATNGRTRRDERADTVVPLTSFSLNTQEQNPSGGETPGGAPPSLELSPIHEQQEEPVTKPADTLALFDVPATSSTDEEAQAPSPSAGTVVAAFVDSYRAHHSGADPLKRDIGRVARESKAILVKGEAGPQELTDAAREMGQGPYSNIAMALKIHRDRGARSGNRKSGVPARPYTDPDWMKVAQDEDRAWYEELMTDDDAIRWARRSADEVQALIARYGEPLAARFEAVA